MAALEEIKNFIPPQRNSSNVDVTRKQTKAQGLKFDRIPEDAKNLLAYAIEAGIEVDDGIVRPIVKSNQNESYWQSGEAIQLITATSKLAAKLKPVSVETLRACKEDAGKAIRAYKILVIMLALIIMPFSVVGFITSNLSQMITTNIETANSLVLRLHTDLSAMAQERPTAPTNRLQDLQELGVAIRVVYSRTRQLNYFLLNKATDHLQEASDSKDRVLELLPGLQDNVTEVEKALSDLTAKYQKVRLFASTVIDGTSVFWGAFSTCLLPVFYALLGACAAVLRAFTRQTELRTFTASYATPARFIVAAIGGGVIGLFNINLGEGLTASPLALAFLVGYAADVFFSFLEGSIDGIKRPLDQESTTRQVIVANGNGQPRRDANGAANVDTTAQVTQQP